MVQPHGIFVIVTILCITRIRYPTRQSFERGRDKNGHFSQFLSTSSSPPPPPPSLPSFLRKWVVLECSYCIPPGHGSSNLIVQLPPQHQEPFDKKQEQICARSLGTHPKSLPWVFSSPSPPTSELVIERPRQLSHRPSRSERGLVRFRLAPMTPMSYPHHQSKQRRGRFELIFPRRLAPHVLPHSYYSAGRY